MLTKDERTELVLRQASDTLNKSRLLVLEMRRLLMKHAPIADAEVIAALALSHELVGD